MSTLQAEVVYLLMVTVFLLLLLLEVTREVFRIWKQAREERIAQPRQVMLEIEVLSAPARPPTLQG